MVLDFNFTNPYKTAGVLFFGDNEDAKKNDNNVVKVKSCLIKIKIKMTLFITGQRFTVQNGAACVLTMVDMS